MQVIKGKQVEDLYCYKMNFDGGAVPNPGRCAGAYVIYDSDYNVVEEGGKYIEFGTNNIGEYQGLLCGLRACSERGIKSLKIKGDSKLVISQIAKVWKINQPELAKIAKEIWELVDQFDFIAMEHVLRNENKVADKLSDETLDKKKSWIRFFNKT
jgi:probable phosphoglycerate mutase